VTKDWACSEHARQRGSLAAGHRALLSTKRANARDRARSSAAKKIPDAQMLFKKAKPELLIL
jgi:hypothetical protein